MKPFLTLLTWLIVFLSVLLFTLLPLCGFVRPLVRPLGDLHGEGDGPPLQHSCLENPVDGGAWWAAVHEVTKSWT